MCDRQAREPIARHLDGTARQYCRRNAKNIGTLNRLDPKFQSGKEIYLRVFKKFDGNIAAA
jgi:hypothetical protein